MTSMQKYAQSYSYRSVSTNFSELLVNFSTFDITCFFVRLELVVHF